MKVFSHKDGLDSLTNILSAKEIPDGYLLQFDYGGMLMETILKLPFTVRHRATISDMKNVSSLADERLLSIEQRLSVLLTHTSQIEQLRIENQVLVNRISSLESKVEKQKAKLKGNDDSLGFELIQLAFSRLASTSNSVIPIIPRAISVSTKKLEVTTVVLTDSGEKEAVLIVKKDDENDINVKLLWEEGIYSIWVNGVGFDELVCVCLKLSFKLEEGKMVIGVPVSKEDVQWFNMDKISNGFDVMDCVIRSYQFLASLAALEIPVSVCITSPINVCDNKDLISSEKHEEHFEIEEIKKQFKQELDVFQNDVRENLEKMNLQNQSQLQTNLEEFKTEFQNTIKNDLKETSHVLQERINDVQKTFLTQLLELKTSSNNQKDSNNTPKLSDDTKLSFSPPLDQQPVIPKTRARRENVECLPVVSAPNRLRNRRDAFYHAQQPVFNSDGKCIAIGSTIQLPDMSFSCKITQQGVVKIGKSVLPEDAIYSLNEVEVGIAQTIGRRPYMEDTVSVYETNIPFMEVIGVFDGHNGKEAAIKLSSLMGPTLKKALKDTKKDVKEALTLLYDKLHSIVAGETESGSTASIVAIEGNKAYISHVGDSPVFIVRKNTKKLEKITVNHHLDVTEERKRIEDAGGKVKDVNGVLRVEGNIALTRSLGDRSLHPILSCVPDITVVDVNDVNDIIIVSDGVTDVLSESDITSIITKSVNVDTAANGIRDLAFKKQSTDNITAVVIKIPE
ncbi:Protein phosphatase 2C [Entamoeba marina]